MDRRACLRASRQRAATYRGRGKLGSQRTCRSLTPLDQALDAALGPGRPCPLLPLKATRARMTVVDVRLLCSEEELCRRMVSPERIERFKTVDAENARRSLRAWTILRVDHPNALTLDVTTLPATEAVRHAAAANAAKRQRLDVERTRFKRCWPRFTTE
jgi:hypothetical protein